MKHARHALSFAFALAALAPDAHAKPKPAAKPAPTAVAPAASAPAPDQADDETTGDADGARPALDLHPRTGEVTIGDGLAKLTVPASFGFLEPKEAEEVLVKLWGNPPGNETLGMIVPAGVELDTEEGWAVVISYQSDGHVSDDDAEKIDYAEMLKDMQASAKEENPERVKGGFDAIEIIGWAEPPRYDKGSKKLYWAKELKFGEATAHTLNYNVRVLGKDGVLVLNAVAGMPQLPQIARDMKDVIAFTDFAEGHRYDQFNPKTDKVAAYGIAALVAGGVAAKAGLFKGLIAILIAGKKLVLAGAAAAAGAFAKLFKRNKRVA